MPKLLRRRTRYPSFVLNVFVYISAFLSFDLYMDATSSFVFISNHAADLDIGSQGEHDCCERRHPAIATMLARHGDTQDIQHFSTLQRWRHRVHSTVMSILLCL